MTPENAKPAIPPVRSDNPAKGSPLNRSCAGQRPAARVGVAGAGSGLTCGFVEFVDRRSTPAEWRARTLLIGH